MFGSGFLRARLVRKMVSTVAALLAFAGGALVLVGALDHGLVVGVFALLVALASLVGAWWIYRGGKALFFPRARLSFAGFFTMAAGVVLYLLGFGLDAFLVIAGGILSWFATIL